MNDPTLILTPEATLVYPSLFEPSAFKDGEPTYNCTLLIPKAEDIKPLREACRQAAFVKWGANVQMQGLRSPIRDGNQKAIDENGTPDKTNFYYDMVFIHTKSKFEVPVVNVYNETITNESEVYGGCVVRAYLSFFAYDYLGNRGVSAGLRAICKISDGTPLGGGRVDTGEAFKQFIQSRPSFIDNPPDMQSREYNETGQQGQSGNRIVGPGEDPWNQEKSQEPREPGMEDQESIPF